MDLPYIFGLGKLESIQSNFSTGGEHETRAKITKALLKTVINNRPLLFQKNSKRDGLQQNNA